MNENNYPRIDWVKWPHWNPIKLRPVIFIKKDNDDFLCIPGTSLTGEVDFSLRIFDGWGDQRNLTHFNWHEAKSCCSRCHGTSLSSYPVSELESNEKNHKNTDTSKISSVPNDYEIPSGSEFICNCELLVQTTKGYSLTFKISNPPKHRLDWGSISEKDTFELKDRLYHVDWHSFKANCTICQKNTSSVVEIEKTNLNHDQINQLKVRAQDVVCECEFTRFDIIQNHDSNRIGVIYCEFSQGKFGVVYLNGEGKGFEVKPTQENNLRKPYYYGEIEIMNSGFKCTRIGYLKNREDQGKLGWYISDGDMDNLPW
jgi:hypothetical protein